MSKEKILQLLNHALELEHSAHIQYLGHAELIGGLEAEPIIARLKEIASDELKHQAKFRELIGLLGGVPSLKMAPAYPAKTMKEILVQNIKAEKEAIDTYKKILVELKKEKANYYDLLLEHEIRHIAMEEQEHLTELELLQNTQGQSY